MIQRGFIRHSGFFLPFKIILCLALFAPIFFTGCETPKERREREAEEKRTAKSRAETARLEAEAADKAREDYIQTEETLAAIQGDYSGQYLDRQRSPVSVSVRTRLRGGVSRDHLDQLKKDSEIRAFRDGLALDLEVIETFVVPNQAPVRSLWCQTTVPRPEFRTGTIRFVCANAIGATVGAGPRQYEIQFSRLGMEESASQLSGPQDPQVALQEALQVSEDLINRRLPRLEASHLLISTSQTQFTGRLVRTSL